MLMIKNDKHSFLNSLKVTEQKGLPKSPIQEQQKFLHDTVSSYLDIYQDKNSIDAKKYMCYLAAAIYLTYRKMYPNLVIRIPFRTKSDISYSKNIQKEFEKSLENIFRNLNLDEKVTLEDLKNFFLTEPTTKDIQAATILLDHFREPVLLTYEDGQYDAKHELPNKNDVDFSDSISDLVAKDMKYTNFITETRPKINEYLSEKSFLKLKKQILEGIVDLNYHGFDDERYPSYEEDLRMVQERLTKGMIQQNFASSITELQKGELKSLLSNMQHLLEDKLQFNILNNTIGNVLDQKIIKDTLHVTYDYSKTSKKPNGFAAIYYTLHTPYGDIELFMQSQERYYQSKKGSAFHSGMSGKSLDIKEFFEYVNPKNETQDLSEFLDSVDLPISVLEDDSNPVAQKELSDKLKRIKIKDNVDVSMSVPTSVMLDSNISDFDNDSLRKKAIAENKIHDMPKIKMNTDDYLYSLAISRSACLNTCSSGHGLSPNAAIHHQDIDDEFAEVLRRRDSITCLGDILLKRLRNVIRESKIDDLTNINKNISIANLPKLITFEEIYEYGSDLDKKIDESNSLDSENENQVDSDDLEL